MTLQKVLYTATHLEGTYNMTYDFATELFSDLHKDAHGYRPSPDHMFYSQNDYNKQCIWDHTHQTLLNREADEAAAELEAVKDFKIDMFSVNLMDTNEQALARMVDIDTLEDYQDIEHWVWSFGILFTPFGKEIVETLENMKKVK